MGEVIIINHDVNICTSFIILSSNYLSINTLTHGGGDYMGIYTFIKIHPTVCLRFVHFTLCIAKIIKDKRKTLCMCMSVLLEYFYLIFNDTVPIKKK